MVVSGGISEHLGYIHFYMRSFVCSMVVIFVCVHLSFH